MDHRNKYRRGRQLGVTCYPDCHCLATTCNAASGLVSSQRRPSIFEVYRQELPDPHAPTLEVPWVYVHGRQGAAAERYHEELPRVASLGTGAQRVGLVATTPPGRCRLHDSSIRFHLSWQVWLSRVSYLYLSLSLVALICLLVWGRSFFQDMIVIRTVGFTSVITVLYCTVCLRLGLRRTKPNYINRCNCPTVRLPPSPYNRRWIIYKINFIFENPYLVSTSTHFHRP